MRKCVTFSGKQELKPTSTRVFVVDFLARVEECEE
jgi:hypothetical protein